MSKKNKSSRKALYETALRYYGIPFDMCEILAYRFASYTKMVCYHYALLTPPKVNIIFFDCPSPEIAQVLVKKGDTETIERCDYFAGQNGGTRINSILD